MMALLRLLSHRFSRAAAYLRQAGPDDLLQAVYRQALLDLLPFVRGGRLLRRAWEQATPEERGKALSAALFLADVFPWPRIHRVARRLLSLPERNEAEELLLSARFAAYPWQDELPAVCFRCGREPATWRPVFSPPERLPDAYRWRYSIPENHVPLCRTCAGYAFPDDPQTRLLWGRAVWGVRFDAWERLHRAFVHGEFVFPRWNKDASPLWPQTFGGKDWASGKGILLLRYPRPYSVQRLAVHREAARSLMSRFPLVRSRWPQSFLHKVSRRPKRQKSR